MTTLRRNQRAEERAGEGAAGVVVDDARRTKQCAYVAVGCGIT